MKISSPFEGEENRGDVVRFLPPPCFRNCRKGAGRELLYIAANCSRPAVPSSPSVDGYFLIKSFGSKAVARAVVEAKGTNWIEMGRRSRHRAARDNRKWKTSRARIQRLQRESISLSPALVSTRFYANLARGECIFSSFFSLSYRLSVSSERKVRARTGRV